VNSVQATVLGVLARHLSSINANQVLVRAMREARLTGMPLGAAEVTRLVPQLERGLRLFLPASSVGDVVSELHRAFAPAQPPAPRRLEIVAEPDISEARLTARALCEQLGARRVVVQKVATIVSELARNIFMYTDGGTIDLVPTGDGAPRLLVRATDRGRGIAHLEEVMSGRYRSKTGLGAGLLGTKRLVDRFEIETGPTGTRVEAEVAL
jgi:serine/threonine-protein kinase RsbT